MKLVQIVLLFGTHCVSPVDHIEGLSEAAKVPCAIIVSRDSETGAVTTEPPGLAAAPEVMAVLAPHQASAAPASRPKFVAAKPVVHRQAEASEANDFTGSIEPAAVEKGQRARAESRSAKPAAARTKQAAKSPPDRCGSYRAVWYTRKSGARRYKCVKPG